MPITVSDTSPIRALVHLGRMGLLMDEAAGRTTAKRLGLEPVGVLGILLRAKHRGLLHEISPSIDRLRVELGFFISDDLRAEVRRLAGE